MITYKQVDESQLTLYDQIPMIVHIKSILEIQRIDNGLGGILLKEIPVKERVKDLGQYEVVGKYKDTFDLTNWAFFMAFDDNKPIGGAIVLCQTENVNMLAGRDDLSVLWDIRVDDSYKNRGIGKKLFLMTVEWSKKRNLNQMKIECQNNNVGACKFYQKQGALLGEINEYAYYKDPDTRDEVQLIWYLDLRK